MHKIACKNDHMQELSNRPRETGTKEPVRNPIQYKPFNPLIILAQIPGQENQLARLIIYQILAENETQSIKTHPT